MLENYLKDENTERMFNQLKLYIREMEDLPIHELVAQAKKFINQAIRRL